MNILYLTYDGLTDPLGRSQVLPYLCGLSRKGHQITVLSCDKALVFNSQEKNVKEITRKNNIVWHSVPYSKKYPLFSAMKNLKKMQTKAVSLCKENDFDIVHCRSYMGSKIGLKLQQKFGLKFIFDMRGFFADERVDGGVWNLSNPIYLLVYNYFKRIEKHYFSQADHIISLTDAGKIILEQQFKVKKPITVIPCCADLNHFSRKNVSEETISDLKQQWGISSKDLVISYVGSLGTWYMLEEMMRFVKQLIESRQNVKFLLITPDDKSFVTKIANRFGIDDKYLIVKAATREQVPSYMSLSSVSLFFIKPVFSKKASSPTKMGELLSMGIPIIANTGVGDVDSIIKDTDCGIVVEDFSKEGFQKAIDKIDNLLLKDKQLLIDAAEKYYSLEKGVEAYHRVYTLH